jgi:alkylhydroperoxidase/carboxymuconolactone decarboxylase family protein YurZ
MPDDDTESNVGAEITGSRDYDHSYEGWAAFCDADPEWAERYNEFVEYVLRRDCDPEEGLSRKIRELLIVAFAAEGGHVDVCANHMAKASDYGATRAEIHQTIQLAAVEGSNVSMLVGSEAMAGLDLD